MQTPVYRAVGTIVATLNTILREDFEERAGIIEFDGKLAVTASDYCEGDTCTQFQVDRLR